MTCLETKQIWSANECCNLNLSKSLSSTEMTYLMTLVHTTGTQTITNDVTCGQVQNVYEDSCGCSANATAVTEINQSGKDYLYSALIS